MPALSRHINTFNGRFLHAPIPCFRSYRAYFRQGSIGGGQARQTNRRAGALQNKTGPPSKTAGKQRPLKVLICLLKAGIFYNLFFLFL